MDGYVASFTLFIYLITIPEIILSSRENYLEIPFIQEEINEQ